MADMASIRGRFLTTKVSLVSPDFDRTAPRRYLNDHNEAVPFRKTGLEPEDMEVSPASASNLRQVHGPYETNKGCPLGTAFVASLRL